MIFLLFFACSKYSYGQQKYEKEYRLNDDEIPYNALCFIDSLDVEEKIKWYLEEGIDRKSIEAKYKLNNQKYSVEFDTTGNLEDIEIQIAWRELQKTLRGSINSHLEKECRKYKIKKVQIQYSGDGSTLLSKLKTGKSAGDYVIRYEIIAKCKSVNDVALFEYLFDDAGQKLTAYEIIFKNSSHLEY